MDKVRCKHCNNLLVWRHRTEGHWRLKEYVGGDIWEVICWWCGYTNIHIVSCRFDIELDKKQKSKLIKMKNNYPKYPFKDERF